MAQHFVKTQKKDQQDNRSLVLLWYRLTAPPAPSNDASLAERELFRRGRLASIIIFVQLMLFVLVLPVTFLGPNITFRILFLCFGALILVALNFNRRNQVAAAGVVIVVGASIVIMGNILSTPGGLDVFTLPMFDILLITVLVGVSMLPAWSVFLIAGANIIFVLIAFNLMDHTEAFKQMLNTASYDAVIRPISLQVIVAVVTFLWVLSASRAIKRADLAEEISKLHHDLALQNAHSAEQKLQLDASVDMITQTLVRVANGDNSARITTTHDSLLWQIEGSINHLLGRLQRLRQAESENKRINELLDTFVDAIRRSRQSKQVQYFQTGTPLDALYYELLTSDPQAKRAGQNNFGYPRQDSKKGGSTSFSQH